MSNKTKPQHPFTRKLNESELIKALITKCLTLEEDFVVEDYTTSEGSVEKYTSILVHSKTTNNANPADLYILLSTTYEKKFSSKTKLKKCLLLQNNY